MLHNLKFKKNEFDIQDVPATNPVSIHNEKHLTHHHNFDRLGISSLEDKHINWYTQNSYPINMYLITKKNETGRDTPDILESHKHLQNAIGKTNPLSEPLSVFSGVDRKHRTSSSAFSGFKKGEIYHTPSYTSTSLKPSVALKFAGSHLSKDKPNGRRHILHFKLPKGYDKGLYIANNATPHNQKEKEFLLAPDQKWKVTNHTIAKGTNKLLGPSYEKHGKHYYTHIWTLEPHEKEENNG